MTLRLHRVRGRTHHRFPHFVSALGAFLFTAASAFADGPPPHSAASPRSLLGPGLLESALRSLVCRYADTQPVPDTATFSGAATEWSSPSFEALQRVGKNRHDVRVTLRCPDCALLGIEVELLWRPTPADTAYVGIGRVYEPRGEPSASLRLHLTVRDMALLLRNREKVGGELRVMLLLEGEGPSQEVTKIVVLRVEDAAGT